MRSGRTSLRSTSTFWADVGELDTPRGDELERFGDVLGFLHPHSRISVVSTERGVTLDLLVVRAG